MNEVDNTSTCEGGQRKREYLHLKLIDDAEKGLADVAAGKVKPAAPHWPTSHDGAKAKRALIPPGHLRLDMSVHRLLRRQNQNVYAIPTWTVRGAPG
ncbi:hypothetical protein [Pigmentiphaga litoralis]|uniref:Uncharacterized protein n=1 Tax=Pigmentiphaga litoralis TaxID=516702 RepID=A0A7Y9IRY0_9BURK|nr:hypothetical protein [Pigmentiphaga litoralis]NYE24421.1 hypothetical protein [Pigmentiphaga litoralis]NYE81965.1 hypothetical protein [Pigmentiphaga litoralis]